jgi:hypothetical protein
MKNLIEARSLALKKFDQAHLLQLSGKTERGISFFKFCDEYFANPSQGTSKDFHNDTNRRDYRRSLSSIARFFQNPKRRDFGVHPVYA